MYSTTKSRRGFTLLEILVALAVGSIIAVGTFEMFKNIIDIRSAALEKGNYMETVYKTVSLMERDIRCKIGNFEVSHTFGMDKLSFETTNSLVFGGSVPVNVSYYMKRDGSDVYLVREESNTQAEEDIKIYLTDVFKKIAFKFYSNGRWSDYPSPIVKIYLYSKNGYNYVFSCRGVVE